MNTARVRGSLGEVIDRMLESERRLDPPAPAQADDIIRSLLAAITNLERARNRTPVDPTSDYLHCLGATRRLAAARQAAEEFLKPGANSIC